MDYARFLALRGPLWDRFERALPGSTRELARVDHDRLEALAADYRRILHDHALARARFPGTAASHRLARLALAGTRHLTRHAEEGPHGLRHFFRVAFPRAFRRHLPLIGLTTAMFLAVVLFALAMAVVRPGLGVGFIGPDAVDGLRNGRMWTEALTTTVPPAVSSSKIATNNLSVALTAWAGGLTAGLLSLWVVFVNGLMLGSVIGVTLHYSMAGELFEFVSAHGPLELSIILVSAAAGLVLARGMVVATDRPRSVEIQEAGRESLTLVGGALPWLVVLGLVEALISPSPDLSPALKLGVGLALEVLFLTFALVVKKPLPEELEVP